MDVRTTSPIPDLKRREGAPLLIDQEELRSILSSLSHELCRPLVSLRAGFDLLLSEGRSAIAPEQRDHLMTMVGLCDDLLRLTRSYLDYAALVQGSRPLCLGSFTIGALCAEIDHQFAPIARARRIRWELRAERPQLVVCTDASRCQQILGNLVSNAIKYTHEGGQVRVLGRADAESWSVVITDSGPGIPTEWLEAVFEPFVRLAREEHSGVEGSGLGLAICRELVSQLGGEISVRSVPGHGSTFTVRFPLQVRSAGCPRGAAPVRG
jgi:signal transduction histidine kinase